MTGVLSRYAARLLLARLVVILIGLSALLILLDFLEDGDQVLASGEGTVAPILRYVGLRLPGAVSMLIPIAALLAGLLAFAELARHRELVVIFSAGMSRLRLVIAALPVAFLIAGIQFVIEDQAVPFAAKELRRWGIGDDDPHTSQTFAWIHLDGDIVRYRPLATGEDGPRLVQVTIYRRDADGALIEAIDADRAVYEPGGWVLYDGHRAAGGQIPTQRFDRLRWSGGPDPSLLAEANAPPGTRPLADLAAIVALGGLGDYPPYVYRLALNERLVRPVMTILLVILGVALVHPLPRRGSVGIFIATGAALGALCWTAAALLTSIGELGLLPPVLAAWAPAMLVACLAGLAALYDSRRAIWNRR